MSGMLGNYACPLLVLDFSSSLQQLHMMHTVEEEAAASFFFFLHSKKIYNLQAINIQLFELDWSLSGTLHTDATMCISGRQIFSL